MKKEAAALHTVCAVVKAVCTKSLFEVSTDWVEKAAQKKKIEEMMRSLEKELATRERDVAEKRHMDGAVVVKEKLVD